jgi:hypothetical protein
VTCWGIPRLLACELRNLHLMGHLRALKVICLVGFTVSLCSAQKATPASQVSLDGGQNSRPAIFQRTPVSLDGPQLSRVNLRLASDVQVGGMELTLEKYAAAFESLNLAEMKQVWPDLDRQHATAFKDVFSSFKGASSTPRLGLQCAVPEVTAGTANVECRETINYRVGKGKGKDRELGPVRLLIQLKDQSGQWVVTDMKGSS